MSSLRKALVAIAEYRPSLIDSAPGIPLAVIVEVEVGRQGVIALVGPTALREEDLRRLDGLGRELLASPAKYFRSVVEDGLRHSKGMTPIALLRMLSEKNDSSVSIGTPREITVEIRLDPGADLGAVASQIAQHVLFAARSGASDPLDVEIKGRSSGEWIRVEQQASSATDIEPHIAQWANDQERQSPEWRSQAA